MSCAELVQAQRRQFVEVWSRKLRAAIAASSALQPATNDERADEMNACAEETETLTHREWVAKPQSSECSQVSDLMARSNVPFH